MTEHGSESLPFEPPEQENVRLREENARLRRLLAVHSIPIPRLAPENPPPAKAVQIVQPVDREERARRRIALFRSLFRGREDVYARRWDNDEHLQYFAAKLAGVAQHVFVLKGGMGKKQRRETAAALAAVPENESRVILATGSYIGEGFDDARLDTLFLAMPISWKGTLQQYVGRLHRLHADKRFVQVYDYVDGYVLMLSRMYERRLKGYAAIGYVIEQEAFPPCPSAVARA